MSSLDQARATLRDSLDEGTQCPCCEQHAQRYRRKLNSGMARSLVWLADNSERWVDVQSEAPAYVLRSRELGKLAWWGLAETAHDETKRGASGMWRATQRGLEFVFGSIRLPSHALAYNGTVEGFDGDQIGIRDALGEKFSLDELLAGPALRLL